MSSVSNPSSSNQWHVGLIGYGEVGRILAEDLRQQDIRVTAYDLKLDGAEAGAPRAPPARGGGVWGGGGAPPGGRGSPLSSSGRCRGARLCRPRRPAYRH